MKKLFIIAVFIPFASNGQKLIVNKYDKFNGWHEKQTSWQYLCTKMSSALTCHVIQKGDSYYLQFKMGLGDVFRMDEGEKAIILFKDQTKVEIDCVKGDIAYKKNGQWMCPATYALSNEDVELLRNKEIEAIRMPIGSNEYADFELKDKHSNDIKDCFTLL